MTEQALRIYRLIPRAAPDDGAWDLAPNQGEVVARAYSPADARLVAAEAEGDFPEMNARPGDGVRTAPASAFRDGRLYAVVEEASEHFAREGARRILGGRVAPAVLRPAQWGRR